MSQAISDYQPYELPEEEATFRSELNKSLSAYTKNHFPSGYCAVSSSQYPLLPPAPPEPSVSAAAITDSDPVARTAADETERRDHAVKITEADPRDAQNENEAEDERPEGDVEPEPTPAVGLVTEKKSAEEEVDAPGGLEKLDEEVEKVKEEKEDTEDETMKEPEASASKGGSLEDRPEEPRVPEQTDESTAEERDEAAPAVPDNANGGATRAEPLKELAEEAPVAVPAPVEPERKQERVDNPTYTLEIVGNRYNPSNYW